MNLEHGSLSVLLAGVAFLLFGLATASDSLQKLASNRIRQILSRLDERGIAGLAVGAILTLLMQSSGAVMATMVNLGTGRVISLRQVMGVIIGTAIGSALTVQLISFHVSSFGLPLFILGFLSAFSFKNRKVKRVSEFAMGLGLLFFGLEMIKMGSTSLLHQDYLETAMQTVRENAAVSFALSLAITSVFHSSTATLGILMSLVASNVMTVPEALPWIYGANVGTASTGIIAAVKGNHLGRQIAWANFLYRSASVALFLPLASMLIPRIVAYAGPSSQQIALLYMSINVIGAVCFFPFRKFGVLLIEKAIQPNDGEKEFGVKYLKRSTYESFALGLAHAKREILEMGDILHQMTELSLQIFHDDNPELIDRIRVLDDRVDLLLKEIKLFLIRVSDLAPDGMNSAVIDIISVGSELEGAADLIDHHLIELAKKKRKGRLEFSRESWEGLKQIHDAGVRAVSLSLTHFQTEDKTLAQQLVDLSIEARVIEQSARERHISRLSRGQGETMAVSGIYIESVNTYLQLIELISRHAQRALDSSSDTPNSKRRRA